MKLLQDMATLEVFMLAISLQKKIYKVFFQYNLLSVISAYIDCITYNCRQGPSPCWQFFVFIIYAIDYRDNIYCADA